VKTFGNKFRKERERLRYSIEDVASVTKIGARMLKAIEDEHFDLLPGGIFTKGFIRAYAKHLGMNDQEVVAEYLDCIRQRQIDALSASESDAPEPTRGGKKRPASSQNKISPAQINEAAKKQTQPEDELPDLQLPKAEHVRPPKRDFPIENDSRIPWKIVAVATVAITLAAILWIRHAHRTHMPIASSADAMTLRTVEAAAPPPVKAVVAYKEVASKKEIPADKHSQQNTTEDNRTQLKPSQEKSAIASNLAPVLPMTSTPATQSAAALTLVIRAAENSWISITADGQPITHETLIAPAHTTVHAAREITVRTGNAAGLSFLLNGKEIPPQGTEAEAKTFVFNDAGIQPVASAPTSDTNR
jgi:Helix-turn-helix domain/RodZ C-terminal domain